MTTRAPAPARPLPAVAAAAPADAGDRGRLSISERATSRLAVAVLTEVEHVTGTVGRLRAAIGSDPQPEAHPQVDAAVTGSVARIRVRCGVAYPAPVTSTLDRAREHLVSRLHELADLTVAHVDVAVDDLPTPSRRRSVS